MASMENIFENHTTDNGLIYRIYREWKNTTAKHQSIWEMGEGLEQALSLNYEILMANTQRKMKARLNIHQGNTHAHTHTPSQWRFTSLNLEWPLSKHQKKKSFEGLGKTHPNTRIDVSNGNCMEIPQNSENSSVLISHPTPEKSP